MVARQLLRLQSNHNVVWRSARRHGRVLSPKRRTLKTMVTIVVTCCFCSNTAIAVFDQQSKKTGPQQQASNALIPGVPQMVGAELERFLQSHITHPVAGSPVFATQSDRSSAREGVAVDVTPDTSGKNTGQLFPHQQSAKAQTEVALQRQREEEERLREEEKRRREEEEAALRAEEEKRAKALAELKDMPPDVRARSGRERLFKDGYNIATTVSPGDETKRHSPAPQSLRRARKIA